MADLNLSQQTTGLIGGLGMTRVDVYNQRPAPDGKFSGCPHVHAISAEAYYVLEGEGVVEVHTLKEGLKTIPLKPGAYFQFPPNTLHRLIGHQNLAILGIMSNAGLAENGDARIYFGQSIDQDLKQYNASVKLTSKGLEGALERRDLSVTAYMELIHLWENDRESYFQELKRFVELHQHNVRSNPEQFLQHIQAGPLAWGQHTEALLNGEPSDQIGDQFIYHRYMDEPRLGMCGTLETVQTTTMNCTSDS